MRLTWNPGKNSKLKEERGISFEEVARVILSGNARQESNKSRNHPGQWIFVVRVKGKTWLVPFRESKSGIVHLFTIFERKQP